MHDEDDDDDDADMILESNASTKTCNSYKVSRDSGQ
jgi:hypothetical protein